MDRGELWVGEFRGKSLSRTASRAFRDNIENQMAMIQLWAYENAKSPEKVYRTGCFASSALRARGMIFTVEILHVARREIRSWLEQSRFPAFLASRESGDRAGEKFDNYYHYMAMVFSSIGVRLDYDYDS